MNASSQGAQACRGALFMLCASVALQAFAVPQFDAMDPLGTVRKGQAMAKPSITVELAPGDWGNANVQDIKRVLDSAAGEFLRHAGPAPSDLVIRVVPRHGSPRVRYERGAQGQYVMQLTARDERWFQYVFQFSHELCHVLSNFDHKDSLDSEKVDESNQWFEEALCETASLFMLRRLAVVWETNPPTRNWSGYASTFSAYASRLMDEPHRQLPTGQPFADWYRQNQPSLSTNPYLREKNELVAAHLLPLFEANPELWRSIAFLNVQKASAGKPFAQYLADWQAASPDKTLASQVLELFGLPSGGKVTGQKTTRQFWPGLFIGPVSAGRQS